MQYAHSHAEPTSWVGDDWFCQLVFGKPGGKPVGKPAGFLVVVYGDPTWISFSSACAHAHEVQVGSDGKPKLTY